LRVSFRWTVIQWLTDFVNGQDNQFTRKQVTTDRHEWTMKSNVLKIFELNLTP